MSMGQEAGKAVGSFMDIMKGQPLALALVIMNFALIGLQYYQASTFSNERTANIEKFMDNQKEVQKLLSACIVPVEKRSMMFRNIIGSCSPTP